uniref:Uncharacterized protein n=1 Tax=Arundo donax TaxID=35708 RepID=A0A0A9EGP3_ARUDO
MFVLDEADEMLSRGFKDQVKSLFCFISSAFIQLDCTVFIARCFAIGVLHCGCIFLCLS